MTKDTIFFGQMSLEKPNAGKLVQQLLEGFIIMQNSKYIQGHQTWFAQTKKIMADVPLSLKDKKYD